MPAHHAVSPKQFSALFQGPEGGGFTFSTQTGKAPTSGYMVSEAGSERTIPSPMIHPHDLHRYAAEHVQGLSKPNRFFGGWNDTGRGQVDLDTSVNMPSGGVLEESAAKVAMIRHGQRSMFHLDTGDLVTNQYYGQSPEVAHHDIKRRYERAAGEHR
jgi:hypothetical protein